MYECLPRTETAILNHMQVTCVAKFTCLKSISHRDTIIFKLLVLHWLLLVGSETGNTASPSHNGVFYRWATSKIRRHRLMNVQACTCMVVRVAFSDTGTGRWGAGITVRLVPFKYLQHTLVFYISVTDTIVCTACNNNSPRNNMYYSNLYMCKKHNHVHVHVYSI